jgi:hypothetical protein
MHHKRKRPRTKGLGQGSLCGGKNGSESPSHWDILHHSRPRRRRDRENCRKVESGCDADTLVWDLGNRKPHIYYW